LKIEYGLIIDKYLDLIIQGARASEDPSGGTALKYIR